MANPQREDGHVDIANELIESLMKIHLSGREWQIMMVIFRQTWGYCELKNGEKYKDKYGFWVKKKMDRISHSQFEEFTGINRRKIWNILNDLLDKNIIIKTITKKGDVMVCNYGIQKDSNKWRLSPKKVTVTKKSDGVSPKKGMGVSPKKGAKLSPKKVHTKEKKENITKENITKEKGDDFIRVWNEFKIMRKKIRKPMTEKAEELIIEKLEKLAFSEIVQIAILNQSIMNSWQGVFPLKEENTNIYNDQIMEILNYLNEKTNKEYTIDIPDKMYIVKRLKEGRPIETFKKIINIKCDKWMGKINKEGDSMEDYLTPKTLFGINFENYLNEPEKDKYDKYLKKE